MVESLKKELKGTIGKEVGTISKTALQMRNRQGGDMFSDKALYKLMLSRN